MNRTLELEDLHGHRHADRHHRGLRPDRRLEDSTELAALA
jgi:hypothetical protein